MQDARRAEATAARDLVAAAAALASERDPWGGVDGGGRDGDLVTRIGWLDARGGTGADPRALAQVRKVRDQLVSIGRQLDLSGLGIDQKATPSSAKVLRALIAGFPDRVAMRREAGGGKVLMSGGTGAELARGVHAGELFVAVVLTAGPRSGSPQCRAPLIRVAADIDPAMLGLR